ncbi:gamma-glutamyltransferase [Yoonia sp. BS5-3]|uniref:Glutathione hydrolase proenzyme n=1 Tax=Yoonia phaeophyticola TaxID=3137369 RepID=A0ABZ2V2W7_9RHOB
MTFRDLLPYCALTLSLVSPAIAQQAADAVAPEDDTGLSVFENISDAAQDAFAAKAAGEPIIAEDWMIAVANPLAAEAGAAVLADGGTAADAMVAAQAVLGLVEPQSSGLGGGAFLVWYDAASGELTTLDGRETAPLAATPTLFQDENGERLGFFDAVVGGLSVGTPGTPRLMEDAHRRWGQANWADLLTPAITLAEDGFAVSPRMAGAIANDADRLQRFPATAAYFFPGGSPLAAGDLLQNPDYADTLHQLAAHGSTAFYTGPIAEDIVATVRTAEGNPGVLSTLDMALYDVIERPAVCAGFRSYEVCGMGPPSSGALTVGQILGIVDNFALDDPSDPDVWRLIGDASRLAFADRGRYMADSDFVPMPTEGLLDPIYLEERAGLIEGDRIDGFVALPEVAPGNPEWDHAQLWGDDVSLEFPSTSHISIVDRYGNALSMTTTIENGFGSRLFVRGFLLNNELTDFSFATHNDGYPIANRVEPGKRPRSSMSPTIVMEDGAPVLVIGSPGGSRIIGYVAKTIIANLEWGMNIQEAINMPHLVNRFGTYDVEEGTTAADFEVPLTELGYEVSVRSLNSGLHAIKIGDTLAGGADPRREGIALGE